MKWIVLPALLTGAPALAHGVGHAHPHDANALLALGALAAILLAFWATRVPE